jgi:hypothetical protein
VEFLKGLDIAFHMHLIILCKMRIIILDQFLVLHHLLYKLSALSANNRFDIWALTGRKKFNFWSINMMQWACIVWWMQDDEYLASLAADREKEMKAIEEAEAHRLQEEVARKAALEEERRKEEESRRQLEEAQVLFFIYFLC